VNGGGAEPAQTGGQSPTHAPGRVPAGVWRVANVLIQALNSRRINSLHIHVGAGAMASTTGQGPGPRAPSSRVIGSHVRRQRGGGQGRQSLRVLSSAIVPTRLRCGWWQMAMGSRS